MLTTNSNQQQSGQNNQNTQSFGLVYGAIQPQQQQLSLTNKSSSVT